MTECLNCGAPASPRADTVPLCDSCAALAAGKRRGVTFDGKKEPKAPPPPQQQ